MKHVIQLDNDGYFVGLTTADESPLETGVFLLPAGAIDADTPTVPSGKRAKWVGSWVFEDMPQPETYQPTYAELRAREYPPMTDYLDGMVKGDQAQIDAYIAACQAVKAKYPKP
jgi:hypothetical protein